jgi:hypothetical protein
VLAPADAFQATWGVPIYIGEFSAVRWAPAPDAARWLLDVINLLEARGWSWSYHAFREWNGWDLEMDNSYWTSNMPAPTPVGYQTDRATVLKTGLKLNQVTASDPSVVRVMQFVASQADFQITVQSTIGQTYQLQRSSTLLPGGWQNVGDPQAGNGGCLLFIDSGGMSGACGFYRVIATQ